MKPAGPGFRRWSPSATLPLLALLGLPVMDLGAAESWDQCRDRVNRRPAATRAETLEALVQTCGYHPERLTPARCDDLYEQVYPACREDGFEAMSMAASSWVLIFDPEGPLIDRLRRVCDQPATVDRTAFGRLVCGD